MVAAPWVCSNRRAAHDIPGALAIDLTALHWRLDPTFTYRIPEAIAWDQSYVLICRHGYSSSVAAALLAHMGFTKPMASPSPMKLRTCASNGTNVRGARGRLAHPNRASIHPTEVRSSAYIHHRRHA